MVLQSLQVRNILTFFKIVNLIMTFSSVECHEEETTTLLSFTNEENEQVKSGKSNVKTFLYIRNLFQSTRLYIKGIISVDQQFYAW